MAAGPHSIDPATYLEELLAQASPDLMREMLQGGRPCLVDTLTLAHNGPENARDHHAEEHLHR